MLGLALIFLSLNMFFLQCFERYFKEKIFLIATIYSHSTFFLLFFFLFLFAKHSTLLCAMHHLTSFCLMEGILCFYSLLQN